MMRSSSPDPVKPGTDRRRRAGAGGRDERARPRGKWTDGGRRLVGTSSRRCRRLRLDDRWATH